MSKIRESARGETCTLNLPGVHRHDPETVVWAHSPFLEDGRGLGQKAPDWCGCYACHECHDYLDGRRKHDYDREWLKDRFNRALKVSIGRLIRKGILKT